MYVLTVPLLLMLEIAASVERRVVRQFSWRRRAARHRHESRGDRLTATAMAVSGACMALILCRMPARAPVIGRPSRAR